MSTTAEPQAPMIRSCRRCFRPLDGRQVYCSTACLEAHDERAAVLVEHVAVRREWIASQVADLDAQIARLQMDRMRVVGAAETDLAANVAELAALRTDIAAAKAAGEVRFELASDRPARSAAGRMA
ncbi:MAG: hypothetical protein ACXVXF_10430 [Mycobacteriaceae bacterium]